MMSDTSSLRSDDDDEDGFLAETGTDATALLAADHLEVKQMFGDYESLVADGASDDARADLAQQICEALTIHATAEEEIFYAALRDVLGEGAMVDDALAQHAGAKALIGQILQMDPSDGLYDDTVRLLQDAIDQHVYEEEATLFPRAQESDLDLDQLGEQIAQRQDELYAALEAGEA